ncbi:MAG: JmjC domain-containing protein [Burkholderiaceae bacterium]
MKKLALLGGMTPARFLKEYWHKKPLLIRQAIPNFQPLLTREELFSLARREEAESRLITHFDRQWKLDHGPFTKLPALCKKEWTLLVQGVNLHHDAADELLQQFRFLPDARLDDLMISYASDGGGVGPHFDSYDVFLLQAHGKRRWRISAQSDLSLVPGMPLKILSDFQAEEEWVLEPGDMLYLPPQYAHDGIAAGECMTYSVGFRAPSYQELGEGFLQFLSEDIELPGRYADPDLAATSHPAQITGDMLKRVAAHLSAIRFDESDITIFLGEYLSEPKASVYFNVPDRPLSFSGFIRQAQKHGLRLSRKTKMLYTGRYAFINGESFQVTSADQKMLRLMADDRELSAEQMRAAGKDIEEALYQWYRDGWMELSRN